MRPSTNVLKNRCSVYPYAPVQDADAGNDPAACYGSASAVMLPCSAQCKTAERADEFGRVSTAKTWLLTFAWDDVAGLGLEVNDRIDVLESDGVSVAESVYVDGILDRAGRGSAAKVSCRDVF